MLSVDKVRKQSQADTLGGATQQLKTIVTNEPTKAKDIKRLTSYGITFSVVHPLIILKMTLDFETNVLKYVQLCRYEWSETFSVYVDGAFEYVLERVALLTPTPAPVGQHNVLIRLCQYYVFFVSVLYTHNWEWWSILATRTLLNRPISEVVLVYVRWL